MQRRATDHARDRGGPAALRRAGALLRSLADSLDADSVALARTVGDRYVVVATSDPDDDAGPRSVPWDRTLCHLHVTAGAPALSLDVARDPTYGPLVRSRGLPVRSFLTVAVTAGDGRSLGRLTVYDSRPERTVLLERAADIRTVADVLGSLLEQQDALDALAGGETTARLADEHDLLAGVLDRTGWLHALTAEQGRKDAAGTTATVVVVRPVGAAPSVDPAAWLGRAARALRSEVRGSDAVARTAPRELSLLLPGTVAPEDVRTRLLSAVAAGPSHPEVLVAACPFPGDLEACWQELRATPPGPDRPSVGVPSQPTAAPAPVPASPAGPAPVAARACALDRPTLGDLLVDGPSTRGAPPGLRLQMLLEAFARHLGMTMAYISDLDDERMLLRYTWSQTPSAALRPGLVAPRADTYCAAMLDGRIPQAVPDTRDSPVLRALPATAALPVGSYLGAPVVLSDGRVHGSICAFRETPHPELGPGHAALLDAVAWAVAGLVEEELVGAERRTLLSGMVDDVVAQGGPRMVFQPVVALGDGATLGNEALARFESTDTASVFHAVADIDLDDRLQRSAVSAAVRSLPSLAGFLSVNLSARALLCPATLSLLAGSDLSRLVVEVSEHEAVEDYVRLAAVLAPLRADGLRLAVDDAGAGFASLRHVLQLAPDVVKLDIAMVRGLTSGSSQAALLEALSTFASERAILLVAEGVETETELAALLDVGVHAGQGYLLGRPAPLVAA